MDLNEGHAEAAAPLSDALCCVPRPTPQPTPEPTPTTTTTTPKLTCGDIDGKGTPFDCAANGMDVNEAHTQALAPLSDALCCMPKPTPQPTPVPTPVPTPEPTTTTTTTTTTVATCSNVDGKGTPFDCGGMEFNDYSKGSEDPNEGVCCIPTTTTTSTTPEPTPAPTPCECESCTTTTTTTSTATTSTSTTTFTTTPKDHGAAEFDAAYADLGRLLTTNLRC